MSTELTTTWEDEEYLRWYSLNFKDGSNVMALCEQDRDDPTVVTIKVPGQSDPIDLDQITSATRMAIVDASWVTRNNAQTLQVMDATNRLGAIANAAESLRVYRGAGPEALTNPEILEKVLTAYEEFAIAVDTAYIPTKGGIIQPQT